MTVLSVLRKQAWFSWSMLRYGLVFATLGVVTWNYYAFSHFVHDTSHMHFDPHSHGGHGGGDDHDHGDHHWSGPPGPPSDHGGDHGNHGGNHGGGHGGGFDPSNNKHGGDDHHHHSDGHFDPSDPNKHGFDTSDHGDHGGHDESSHGDSHHGRHGDFDAMHLKKDGLFLYGLALPIVLLTLAALIWNPSTSTKGTTSKGVAVADATSTDDTDDTENKPKKIKNSPGDVNVRKWTIIWFVVPLVLIMLDGQRGHAIFKSDDTSNYFNWNLYIRICMSLMSPSGYGATWALALFLIPVTKHSPILDWLRVTPVQALGFHRVAGWTSFWYSVLHGYLHLRHLMDVLNPTRTRTRLQQFKYLLVPESMWKCLQTQNPFTVFVDEQTPYDGTDEEANQCWLALVNATGMISVIAFALLAVTSLPYVRRYSYVLFYRVHIPCAWIMLLCAIWHYPTCALVLIPNIIYYLSFNIPVYVTQMYDAGPWCGYKKGSRSRTGTGDDEDSLSLVKPKSSPLLEANLIKGGSIELVFATTPQDQHRHESRYARVSCAAISPLSHPFSVFSRDDLCGPTSSTHGTSTVSILLRPSGKFTERLTKALFNGTSNADVEELLDQSHMMSVPLITPSPHYMMHVDSYYAGSFDWVNRAMKVHDDVLLVAGGVGIVPFLEFLPNLQQRIQMDTDAVAAAAASSTAHADHASPSTTDVDTEAFLDHDPNAPSTATSTNANIIGPKTIHLHWYCRHIGLASYVWNTHLKHHIEEAWENSPSCQGRLKIHVHLTRASASDEELVASNPGEAVLTSVPKLGLMEKHDYSQRSNVATDDEHAATTTIRPIQDAPFTQSKWLGLLVPGSLIVSGMILHWWWYKQFIVDEMFRHDNLIIRSHGVIFTLILAIVLSIPVEHYYLRRRQGQDHHQKKDKNSFSLLVDSSSTSSSSSSSVDLPSESSSTDGASASTTMTGLTSMNNNLTVSAGRPSMNSVICDTLKADRPGVYSCGPHALMESLEDAIRSKRNDCAFYREDSEM